MSRKKELKGQINKPGKSLYGERHNFDALRPVWMFTKIDRAGDFAFDVLRPDFRHAEFMAKMIDYSNMTWAQIKHQTHDDGRSKHHAISFDSLSKAAQDRFVAKKLDEDAQSLDDDSDVLFSFAFTNMLRIIGLRKGEKFYVLWYDSEHKVCSSYKKHT